jgi:hypothetical protein
MNYGKNLGIYYNVSKKYKVTSAPRKPWITNETWKLIQERSRLKAKVYKTTTITENITVYAMISEKQLEEIKTYT